MQKFQKLHGPGSRPATGSAKYILNLIGNISASKDKHLEKTDAYGIIDSWFDYPDPPKVSHSQVIRMLYSPHALVSNCNRNQHHSHLT
jgi:hypothetical protein